MNLRLLLLIFVVIVISCREDEEFIEPEIIYSPEISFDISYHLFSGKNIKQIDFVDTGFYYSTGSRIYLSDQTERKIKTYSANSEVLSLEFNPKDESLYFGTKSSGLGKAKGNSIVYYTRENSDLPRNLIRQVQSDSDGNIWFNASAHMVGGLVKYNGKNFTEYNPENSDLPENLIYNFRMLNNTVYILSRGVETGKIGLEFKRNKWRRLFESGGCGPTDMDIDSEGNIYFIEDSREYCGGGLFPDDVLFSFRNNQKTVHREYKDEVDFPYILRTDKRNYVWIAKFASVQPRHISVFDGNDWHASSTEFPDDFINCIEVDDENNIWLGTTNGIYVLDQ